MVSAINLLGLATLKVTRYYRLILSGVVLLPLAAMLGAPRARAQVLHGSLVGTVTDPSGAAVPQAAVKITNEGTGAVRRATTDSHGVYSVPSLQAGTYDVNVTKQGFQTYTFTGATVEIDQVVRVD